VALMELLKLAPTTVWYHPNQSIVAPSLPPLALRWAEVGAQHPAVQSQGTGGSSRCAEEL